MKSFIGVLLLLGAYHIQAQSLPAQVISTSGANFMKSNGSWEWTLDCWMIQEKLKSIPLRTIFLNFRFNGMRIPLNQAA
ncbi:MAG: hypothetical protein KBF45_00915 [Cyclobacteriaceae bacterium]|jgi:hypothetical protein|nr:hypothetical protein [Cyclobacteriaceae bacterium]